MIAAFWLFWRTAWRVTPITSALAMIFLVFAVASQMAYPILLGKFIGIITAPFGAAGSTETDALNMLLIFALVYFFELVFWRLNSVCISQIDSRGMQHLEEEGLRCLQRQETKFFETNFTGAMVRWVSRASSGFEDFGDNVFQNISSRILRIAISLGVFFWLMPLIGWVFLGWAALFVLFTLIAYGWKARLDIAVAQQDSGLGGVLADAISANAVVKAFAREAAEEQRLKKTTRPLRWARFFSWQMGNLIEMAQGMLMLVFEVILMLVLIDMWRGGMINVELVVMLQAYTLLLFTEIWNFGMHVKTMIRSLADGEDLANALARRPTLSPRPGAPALRVRRGEVEFREVSFRFADDDKTKGKPVLQKVSFRVPAGQRVGLVGHSGAGKSTIARLLLGLFDPSSGDILVDGQPLSGVSRASIAASVASVPQTSELFHRSILENIRVGKPSATAAQVERAARAANAMGFIRALPQGMHTLVGERGVRLSGGERQRVAMARAFLKDARVAVLDEATSALDAESERIIQSAMWRLLRGRTALVIAHRLSTVASLDRILVISGGRIAQDGTHAELLKSGGIYARLWARHTEGLI